MSEIKGFKRKKSQRESTDSDSQDARAGPFAGSFQTMLNQTVHRVPRSTHTHRKVY